MDFSGLRVKGADFGRSAMHAARMYTKEDNGEPTEFIDCKFWHSHLQGSNMAKATFIGCKFPYAQLIWANLCEAQMQAYEFSETDMTGALLTRCQFSGCKFKGTIMDACDIYGDNDMDKNKNNMLSASFRFAFIYPINNTEILYKENICINGLESNKENYNKERDRIERYLDYATNTPGFDYDGFTHKTGIDDKNKTALLIQIYEKTLKYATPDESVGLPHDELERQLKKLNEKLVTLYQNRKPNE